MDDETVKYVWEKWKSCKNKECEINITNSSKDIATCIMCEKHTNKKQYGKETY